MRRASTTAASSSSSCRARERSRRGRRRPPTSRRTAGSPRSRASSEASASTSRRERRSRLSAADRAALLPLLHDRMTEAVLPRLEDAQALFAHVPPRPLATHSAAGGRPRGDRARERRARPRARAGRDRLSRRRLSPHGTRSDRRRAHDVRAGQLRALPAQDLQRALDRRRRRAGEEPLRDDPAHACDAARSGTVVAYADNAAVMEGARGAALLSGAGRPLRRARRD